MEGSGTSSVQEKVAKQDAPRKDATLKKQVMQDASKSAEASKGRASKAGVASTTRAGKAALAPKHPNPINLKVVDASF